MTIIPFLSAIYDSETSETDFEDLIPPIDPNCPLAQLLELSDKTLGDEYSLRLQDKEEEEREAELERLRQEEEQRKSEEERLRRKQREEEGVNNAGFSGVITAEDSNKSSEVFEINLVLFTVVE